MKLSSKSSNYSVLKDILSKSRRYKLPKEIDYIIMYTFLYKYCSDNLKNHFLTLLEDEEMTLDEAFSDELQYKIFKEEGLQLFGFFIEKDMFVDEIINNHYTNSFFLSDFFEILPKNIVFDEKSNICKYFNYLFKTIENELSKPYEWDSEETLAIKEIILSISKLNLFESEFTFSNVLELISSSRLMHIKHNSDYIPQIFSSIISCEKTSFAKVYDPFMNNASSLMELSRHSQEIITYYGKESDNLTYCYAIVRLVINGYLLNDIIIKQEDATESIDIGENSFDVILSNIPVSIKNYYSNKTQTLEIAKRNKRSELEEVLLKKFDMDSDLFIQDSELNQAIENLLDKMDVEKDTNAEFIGEYESLKDNEFLFLINLIQCLKDDGIMTVSISQNFLFKNSLETLRKYLTYEKNYIDTIISIPEDLGRKRPEVIIVFKKNKQDKDIFFIDMSKDFKTEKNKISFPGLFRRNLILADETINNLKEVFSKKLIVSKFSNRVSIDEVNENNFNLSVSKYVDTFEGEFINLNDLSSEKKDIDMNIKKLNVKIEKMMDELNIKF